MRPLMPMLMPMRLSMPMLMPMLMQLRMGLAATDKRTRSRSERTRAHRRRILVHQLPKRHLLLL
jgi:hypothetical protein